MQQVFTAKYGVQTIFPFFIQKRGFPDLAATADWTPATGDVKISKDSGNFANVTNLPTAVGGSGSVGWTITLTATEMQAARLVIQIVDSATKAVEDDGFTVETFGNASGAYAFDLSVASQVVASVTGAVGSVTGSVASVTGAVGSVTGNVGGSTASVVGAVGSVTGNVGGNVVGSVASVTAVSDKTGYTLSNTGIDAILDRPIAEPAGVFAWASASLRTIIQHMGIVSRNKVTQTATTTLIRNNADNATLATSTVSDDGTVFTRGSLS